MIRPATPQDAGAVAAIWNHFIRTSTITFTTVEKTERDITALIADRVCLVGQEGAETAGFATFGPFRAGPGYRHTAEHSVYVRADMQGAGLGRALMTALEDAAREAGIRVLVAGIGGENPSARDFHARLGFEMAGQLIGVGEKFGRSQDLILMTKKL